MKSINIGGWSFTELNKDTEKAKALIRNYDNYEGVQLWEVYGNYSNSKRIAYEEINSLRARVGGYGLCICTHCISNFTCGFEVQVYEKKYLLYFTHVNNFAICLD